MELVLALIVTALLLAAGAGARRERKARAAAFAAYLASPEGQRQLALMATSNRPTKTTGDQKEIRPWQWS